MPQFNPGEEKVALATFPVAPAGLECAAELWLASDTTPVATSGEIPFVATGLDQSIALPITMPGVEGTYPVHLDVLSGEVLIKSFLADEDVDIVKAGPPTGNLLLNPGFAAGLQYWTRYCNYPGRFGWGVSTGLAVASGNVSGRSVVATMTQTVPWWAEYRGQTFRFTVWRKWVAGTKHEGYFKVSMGGVSNEVYISYTADFVEQSVTATLPLNATGLSVQFQIKPHRDWRSSGLYVNNTDLRMV
ncbi:hypothetical protein ES703_15503 [subsurface metagenome]